MSVEKWLNDFFRMVDDNRLQRGRKLYRAGKVTDFEINSDRNKFYAKVHGSRTKPYTVEGYFSGGSEEELPDLDDLFIECSCPDWVEFCKHSVSVMIRYAQERQQNPNAVQFVQRTEPNPENAQVKELKKAMSSEMVSLPTLGNPPFLDANRELKEIHGIVRDKLRRLG